MTKGYKIFWVLIGIFVIGVFSFFTEYFSKGKNFSASTVNNTNTVRYYDGNTKQYFFTLQMGYAFPDGEFPGVNFQGSPKTFAGDLYLVLHENNTEFQSVIQKAQEWVETAKKENVKTLAKDIPVSGDSGIFFSMVANPCYGFPRVVFIKFEGKMWYFLNLRIFSIDALNSLDWGGSAMPSANIYFDIEDAQSMSNLFNYCTYENFQKIKEETKAKSELFK
jgi:hypothetical protein